MATKTKTKTWVKIVKRIVGFIALYLLLIWIVQMAQHTPCNGCSTPDWSYLTTLIKTSKVFMQIVLVIGIIISVFGLFCWCFGADEK